MQDNFAKLISLSPSWAGDLGRQLGDTNFEQFAHGMHQRQQQRQATQMLRGFTLKGATKPISQLDVGEVGVSGREGGWYPPTRSVS